MWCFWSCAIIGTHRQHLSPSISSSKFPYEPSDSEWPGPQPSQSEDGEAWTTSLRLHERPQDTKLKHGQCISACQYCVCSVHAPNGKKCLLAGSNTEMWAIIYSSIFAHACLLHCNTHGNSWKVSVAPQKGSRKQRGNGLTQAGSAGHNCRA